MKKSKGREALLVARGIGAVLLGLCAAWSVAYLVSAALRGAAWGWSEYAIQLITFVASFCLFAAAAFLLGRSIGAKQTNWFTVLSDAMNRIAQGDFSVSIPVEHGRGVEPMHAVAQSLNQMTQSLKELENMRQQFISDVSHEIQSPLTSITGFAKALQDEGLSAEQRGRYLEIIQAESKRLSRLADGLLRLTSLESKDTALELSRCELEAELRSIILSCEPQWAGKGIEISADLSPVLVTADRTMLAQVWGNLLHNAIKFTPQGGCICVSLRQEGEWAVVGVSDNGIGIGADSLPFVFDRFFKADKSRSAATGGNGLGLSIVQKIVSLHGGTVEAQSGGAGKGATFVVRLPVAPRD